MKIMNKKNLKVWLIALISIGVAAYFYPQLPAEIPNEFGFGGEIEGYSDKGFIFLFPGLVTLFIIAAEVMRIIDPKRLNYMKFEDTFYMFQFGFALFLLVMQMLLIAFAMEWIDVLPSLGNVIMGILFIFLGNVLPKIKYNYSMGIKTPWTLANEQVWYLTHRTSGKIWVIAGLLMLVIGLIPQPWKEYAFATVIVITVFSAYILSYIYFKRIEIQK